MENSGLSAQAATDQKSRLQAILNVCQKINSERNVDALLDLLVKEASRLLGAERATIYLLDSGRNELVSRASFGSPEPVRLDARRGGIGQVMSTGSTLNIPDVSADPRFRELVRDFNGAKPVNFLAAPLVGSEGGVLGAFELVNKQNGPFSEDDEEVLRSLAANAAIAIQTARLIEELSEHRRELAVENRHLWRELGGHLISHSIVGSSEAIQEILRLISRISETDVSVLITGESGTGKDLIARAIHYNSPRARFPYVALNCAALPETLVEAELFGVEKGVATGVEKRIGKFEAAHRGTLFLDEIGDLSLTAQAKILRVLQDQVVEHLGGRQAIPVDVRVVAATNKDLEAEIEAGRFREDLYYRLNVVHIQTPALRQIREDIPLLAGYFLNRFCRELNREPLRISVEAMEVLMNYHWPGNVRQLQNEMKRLAVCVPHRIILPGDLSPKIRNGAAPACNGGAGITSGAAAMQSAVPSASSAQRQTPLPSPPAAGSPSLRPLAEEIAELEETRIRQALAATSQNQLRAAKLLGLSRQGLINKMRRYGIASSAAR